MDNKVILKVKAGSHLYGLNTPQSDLDYIGIYLSTPEELLGLKSSEIIEANVVSKKENGRNDKDAVDCKYYELRRFCQLALNNNPTMLELLFTPDESIVEITDEGRLLLDNYGKFVCTRVKQSYCGYAFSQKQKSFVKTSNLKALIDARNSLKQWDEKLMSRMLYTFIDPYGINEKKGTARLYSSYLDSNDSLTVQKTSILFNYDEKYPDYIQIGDLRFNNQKVKDVLKKLDERINKATGRKDEMLDKGYDPKFMSHTIRLLFEGKELLTTGKLVLPLQEREYLLKCKLSEIPPTEMMDKIEALEQELEGLYDTSPLPKKPNFKAVDSLVQGIYREYLKGHL